MVIGRGGEGVNRLSKQHDVKIQFNKDEEKVTVTGKEKRCEAALSEINSIIDKCKQEKVARREQENAARCKKETDEAYWKKEDVAVRRASDAKNRWATGTPRDRGHKPTEIGPIRPRVTTLSSRQSTATKSSAKEIMKVVWP